MQGFSADQLPGFQDAILSEEVQVWFVGDGGQSSVVRLGLTGAQIKSSVTDSGNTPTTTIRGGNLMAKQTSDGLLYKYSANADDGTQFVQGVLEKHTSMLDSNGVAANKAPVGGILRRGLFHYGDLLGYDLHSLGVLARRGCLFDKDSVGSYGAGMLEQSLGSSFKATDYTVLTTDNGCFLKATAAATFTLPTLAAAMVGFTVRIMQMANANLIITAAADTIIYDDTSNGKATTFTWSTANQKMGAGCVMQAGYSDASGTLAWLPLNIQRTVVAS